MSDLIIKANVAICLFYLVYRFFLAQLTFYKINRYYLIFALLFSVIYPIIPVNEWFFTSKEIPGNLLIRIPDWQQLQLPLEAAETTSYFSIAYWISVCFFGLLFIIKLLGIVRIHLKSVPAKWKLFHFRETMENISPFSFWTNIYFNPRLHPEEEYEKIFMHEQVHVGQLHSLDVLFSEIFLAFFWYNPLCWMIRKSIQENLEFIADQQVLASGINIKNYQYSLIQISALSTHSQLRNHFNFKNLKKRIIMMNKQKSSKASFGSYFLIVPAVIFCSLIFGRSHADESGKLLDGIVEENIIDTLKKPPYESQGDLQKILSKEKNKEGMVLTDTLPDGQNPMVLVDGEKISYRLFESMDSENIKSVHVIKGEKAIAHYGKEAKYGVIEISTQVDRQIEINLDTQLDLDHSLDIQVNTNINENENKETVPGNGSGEVESKDPSVGLSGPIDKDVLILVDGKEIPHNQMENISPNHIRSISVYKGANAEEHFGKKGKEGVIEIFLKGDKP